MIPPVPFFFLKIALAIQGFLYVHTNLEIKMESQINSLETRIEKMQERFNKDLEEIKKSQNIMNNAINEIQYSGRWVIENHAVVYVRECFACFPLGVL